MKRFLIIGVFAAAALSFFAFVLVYFQNTESRILAQSVKTEKSDKSVCNSVNSQKANKPDKKCDFSEYKTLRVQSLKVESLPQPEYTKEVKEKNLTGCVPVRILVDKEGKVSESCALDKKQNVKDCKTFIDDELFQKSAAEAALKAKFDVRRLSLGGKDFFEMTIVYNFTPSEKKSLP